jgi:hypothetical protein
MANMERKSSSKFPPAAIAAFREMVRLEELSGRWPPEAPHHEAWLEQHYLLHDTLGCKPWEFYCVEPPWVDDTGERSKNAKARYIALAEAAGIELG